MTDHGTARSPRANEAWVTELRTAGFEGDVARRDLQAALVAALRRALSGRNAAEVEDFAQDAMLRILGSLDTFRGDSRFLTWACSIAIRVAMSELRKARWRNVSLDRIDASTLSWAFDDGNGDEKR